MRVRTPYSPEEKKYHEPLKRGCDENPKEVQCRVQQILNDSRAKRARRFLRGVRDSPIDKRQNDRVLRPSCALRCAFFA